MTKAKQGIKHNCRYCKHAGEVKNFICWCAVQMIGRATGVRVCRWFEVDVKKYKEYAINQASN